MELGAIFATVAEHAIGHENVEVTGPYESTLQARRLAPLVKISEIKT